MSILSELPTEVVQQLTRGLALGRYSLLVGSGVNSRATSQDGRPLPDGPSLAVELAAAFDVPIEADEDVALHTVYSIIEGEHLRTSDGQDLPAYFGDRFTNCVPSWQGTLAAVPWQTVVTLNVDDVLEKALSAPPRAPWSIRRFNWDDRYEPPIVWRQDATEADKRFQVVHLHGSAAGLKAGRSVVFSLSQYQAAVRAGGAWHVVFQSLFAASPFLIIGASLVHEVDLADILRAGSQSETLTGYPTVAVIRDVAPLMRRTLENANIRVIQADAEEFINELIGQLDVAESIAVSASRTSYGAAKARAFLSMFDDLRNYMPPAASQLAKRDFLRGDEPIWDDMTRNLDILRATTPILSQAVTARADTQTIHCVTGYQGSGKTVVLLQLAQPLISQGYDVYLLRGDRGIAIDPVLSWIQSEHKSVLLVDGMADYADILNNLAAKCSEQDIPLLIVGTERKSGIRRLRRLVDQKFLSPADSAHTVGNLTDDEISRLIFKLDELGRLVSIATRGR